MDLMKNVRTEFNYLPLSFGIKKLEDYLQNIWSKETCTKSLRSKWTADNKSLGQCSITALLVQEIFGGQIVSMRVGDLEHCFNKIGNKIFDLTENQFDVSIEHNKYKREERAEFFLDNDRKNRYMKLLKQLNDTIDKKQTLIEESRTLLEQIEDPEHSLAHTTDVFIYSSAICENLVRHKQYNFDSTVIEICSYWHDVGRIKDDIGHEQISADMLRVRMKKLKFNKEYIDKCCIAVEQHNWREQPKTTEGRILLDADKIGFVGRHRWRECLRLNTIPQTILMLLPRVRSQFLWFDESKEIYDTEIVNLVQVLADYLDEN